MPRATSRQVDRDCLGLAHRHAHLLENRYPAAFAVAGPASMAGSGLLCPAARCLERASIGPVDRPLEYQRTPSSLPRCCCRSRGRDCATPPSLQGPVERSSDRCGPFAGLPEGRRCHGSRVRDPGIRQPETSNSRNSGKGGAELVVAVDLVLSASDRVPVAESGRRYAASRFSSSVILIS